MPRPPEDQRIKSKLSDPNIGAKTRVRLEDDLAEFTRKKLQYAHTKRSKAAVQQYRDEIGEPPKPYDESKPVKKDDCVVITKGAFKNKVGIVTKINDSIAWVRMQGIDGVMSFTKASIAKHQYS